MRFDTRSVIATVLGLNLAYFVVEFSVALHIGSVSLFADSIDFLEDASINLLILAALGWSARSQSKVGMFLASLLLVPGVATLWMTWQKLGRPVAPDALSLSLTGTGALLVNAACALLLAGLRKTRGSLTRAAYLSARNDVLANIAIVAAGVLTAVMISPWPDVVVGLGIFVMNLDAARDVFAAARREYRNSKA